MTPKEKVDALITLGSLTREENVFIVRLSQMLDKGLRLWAQELEFLDHIYQKRVA